MARVEWTRISPDDVEYVSAVLLARENPRAQRIRPSRGDGGIDILVPTGVPSGVDVYLAHRPGGRPAHEGCRDAY
jgi:hypothetical protein